MPVNKRLPASLVLLNYLFITYIEVLEVADIERLSYLPNLWRLTIHDGLNSSASKRDSDVGWLIQKLKIWRDISCRESEYADQTFLLHPFMGDDIHYPSFSSAVLSTTVPFAVWYKTHDELKSDADELLPWYGHSIMQINDLSWNKATRHRR